MANIFGDFLKGAAEGAVNTLALERDARMQQDQLRAKALLEFQTQDMLEERRVERQRRISEENAAILARSNPFNAGMAIGGLGSAATPAPVTPGIESSTQATSAPLAPLQAGDTLTVPPAEGKQGPGTYAELNAAMDNTVGATDPLDIYTRGTPSAGATQPSQEAPGMMQPATAAAPRSIRIGDTDVTEEDYAIAQRKLLGKGGEFVSPDAVMGEALAEARRRQEREDSLNLRKLMAENTIANTKAATALREQQAGTRVSPDDLVATVTSNNLPVYPDIITATTKQSQAAQETAAKEARAYVSSEKAIARMQGLKNGSEAAENALALAEAAGVDSPNIKMALAGDKAVSIGLFGNTAAEALTAFRAMELAVDTTGQGPLTDSERILIRQMGPAITADGQVNINVMRRKAAIFRDARDRERLINSAVTAYQNTSVREKIIRDADELQSLGAASATLRVGDKVLENPAYVSSSEMIQAKATAQQNGEEFDIKDFAAAKVRDAINTAPETVLGPLVAQAQKDGIIGGESEERTQALEQIKATPEYEQSIRKEFERMFRKPL